VRAIFLSTCLCLAPLPSHAAAIHDVKAVEALHSAPDRVSTESSSSREQRERLDLMVRLVELNEAKERSVGP
jgi:hypothetical protein